MVQRARPAVPAAPAGKEEQKAKQEAGKPTNPSVTATGQGDPRSRSSSGRSSFPGVSYLDALDHIPSSTRELPTVLLVVGFCMIQQMLLELPLLGYVFAPESTQDRVTRFQAWMGAKGRTAAVSAPRRSVWCSSPEAWSPCSECLTSASRSARHVAQRDDRQTPRARERSGYAISCQRGDDRGAARDLIGVTGLRMVSRPDNSNVRGTIACQLWFGCCWPSCTSHLSSHSR